jgi:hypothetical protein
MGAMGGTGMGMGVDMGSGMGQAQQMNILSGGMYQPGPFGYEGGAYGPNGVPQLQGTYDASYGSGMGLDGGPSVNSYSYDSGLGTSNDFGGEYGSDRGRGSGRGGAGRGGSIRGGGRGGRGGRGGAVRRGLSRGSSSSARGGSSSRGRARGGVAKVKREGKNPLLGDKPGSGWESLFGGGS